ncbi:alpha/beta fold hydrolase [Pelagibius sp. Alg239-R121]|uniref:alpha/beta fold hydrolase n=1 Tax=Pelagibius sp. Alg239-R121 TaxID=2993448 RepID=UPI0024A62C7E|nr:alpha/beta hydrolase [Pelagibius sp. Alg239-R121]
MKVTVDGNSIFAATGGKEFDPNLPAVVFVHGAGMDRTVWSLQSRYFAHHGHSVLAVDLPGHGLSDGAPLESIEAIADWLAVLLDAVGVEKAAVAGHSMGAISALEFAARQPGRAKALALLGVAASMPVHPALLKAAQANDHLAVDLVTSWAHGDTGHLGGNMTPGLWMLGGGARLLERASPGVLHNDLAACSAYEGGQAAAERVACETLLVLGSDDKMTPFKAGTALASMISAAQVARIEGSGHMMMLEKPDDTLAALKAFL